MARCVSTNLVYLWNPQANNVRNNIIHIDVIIIKLYKQNQPEHSFLDFRSSPVIVLKLYIHMQL